MDVQFSKNGIESKEKSLWSPMISAVLLIHLDLQQVNCAELSSECRGALHKVGCAGRRAALRQQRADDARQRARHPGNVCSASGSLHAARINVQV